MLVSHELLSKLGPVDRTGNPAAGRRLSMHREIQNAWSGGESTHQKWGPLMPKLPLRGEHVLRCNNPALSFAEAAGCCGTASLRLLSSTSASHRQVGPGAIILPVFPHILPWRGVTTQTRKHSGSADAYVEENWPLLAPRWSTCG